MIDGIRGAMHCGFLLLETVEKATSSYVSVLWMAVFDHCDYMSVRHILPVIRRQKICVGRKLCFSIYQKKKKKEVKYTHRQPHTHTHTYIYIYIYIYI